MLIYQQYFFPNTYTLPNPHTTFYKYESKSLTYEMSLHKLLKISLIPITSSFSQFTIHNNHTLSILIILLSCIHFPNKTQSLTHNSHVSSIIPITYNPKNQGRRLNSTISGQVNTMKHSNNYIFK